MCGGGDAVKTVFFFPRNFVNKAIETLSSVRPYRGCVL